MTTTTTIIIIPTMQRIEWKILNPDPMDMSPLIRVHCTHAHVECSAARILIHIYSFWSIDWNSHSRLSFCLNSDPIFIHLIAYDSGSVNWTPTLWLLQVAFPCNTVESRRIVLNSTVGQSITTIHTFALGARARVRIVHFFGQKRFIEANINIYSWNRWIYHMLRFQVEERHTFHIQSM